MNSEMSTGSSSRFMVDLNREGTNIFTVPAPYDLFEWAGDGLEGRLSADVSKLERVRAGLPRTLCEQCGHCCLRSENISTYSIEFYLVAQYLKQEMPAQEVAALKKHVEFLHFSRMDFYDTFDKRTGHAQIPCPMYRPGEPGCWIYPVRPNTCRAYGLIGLGIDADNPCKRQCIPPCDKLSIHPDDADLEWDCCDIYGLNLKVNRFSQYYIHHPHSNQIGNFFDLLNWLVYFFDLPVMD